MNFDYRETYYKGKDFWRVYLQGQDLHGCWDHFRSGDTLKIEYETLSGYWKVRSFEGLCVSKKNHHGNCRYTLYKVIKGTKIFFSVDIENPYILNVTRVKTNHHRYKNHNIKHLFR